MPQRTGSPVHTARPVSRVTKKNGQTMSDVTPINSISDYDRLVDTATITGRMMAAMEELVQYQVDLLINEENEWFIELLDQRIEERIKAHDGLRTE